MTSARHSPSQRLTKAEKVEIRLLDRLLVQLKHRRRQIAQRAFLRTEHWREKGR